MKPVAILRSGPRAPALVLAALTSSAFGQCRPPAPAGWVAGFGVPGTDGIVGMLAVIPVGAGPWGGDLIAGGLFNSVGGVSAEKIARYRPGTGDWTAVGGGLDDTAQVVAVLPGGDLVVGGNFTDAGGVLDADRIARFSPATNTWSALGTGTSAAVYALAVLPDGDIVAASNFTFAGGVAAGGVARYDWATGAWSALGSGTNATVFALAVVPAMGGVGVDLIAAGNFSAAGGVPAANIARYSFATGAWSALGAGGGGTNARIDALALMPAGGASGGELIVGGAFTMAGGAAANSIARYIPSTGAWSPLGSGVITGVLSLATLPAGSSGGGVGGAVVAGGTFVTAGGAPASRIARYDFATSAWTTLGSGVNHWPRALAMLAPASPGSGDLIAGGSFNMAGGQAANQIARYSFGSSGAPVCYANCDCSTTAPALNVADFTCFLQQFAAGNPTANCDQSTTSPVLNVADFTCFLQRFAAGCP